MTRHRKISRANFTSEPNKYNKPADVDTLFFAVKQTLSQWRHWACFSFYLVISIITGLLIFHHVPEPYMDEIFHLEQAQRYCRGDWSYYHSKLTTPPGLYIISLPFSWLLGCDTSAIRLTNFILGGIMYWAWAILLIDSQTLSKGIKNNLSGVWIRPLTTLAVAIFPISFFFHHLFYTDTASNLTIALSLLLSKYQFHWFSALMCLLSLTIRQTNVVWIAFILVWSIIEQLARNSPNHCQKFLSTPANYNEIVTLVKKPLDIMKVAFSNFRNLFGTVIPYMVVLSMFGSFVVWNGGIVLGDRSNHKVSIHLPQLWYFLIFTSCLLWPHLLDQLTLSSPFSLFKEFSEWIVRCLSSVYYATCLILLLTGITYSIHSFTIHHPFILSDNRHITFYIWKNLFRKYSWLPLVYTPLYLAAGWVWVTKIFQRSERPVLFWIGFIFVVILTLVPTPLLELRYFIPHFLFLRVLLMSLSPTKNRILAELLGYLVLHFALLYRFLFVTFEWNSEPGRQQRLMW